MKRKDRVSLSKEVIHAFGGVKAASVALGVPQTTVSYWNKSGIPAWRLALVRETAARLSVELPNDIAA